MREDAYRQYQSEASNWLKSARLALLRSLLRQHAGSSRTLRILEIGAGVGQNVEVLREFGTVDVLEVDPRGIEALRVVEGVRRIFEEPIPDAAVETYDIIVAFDVLEHLEDDRAAAAWIADHLEVGGLFLATVPAYQWLFSGHDVALHHYRRYTRRQLISALEPVLAVRRSTYFVCLLFPIAALMRLLSKARAAVQARGTTGGVESSKQSSSVPGLVDGLLGRQLRAEVRMIDRGVSLPFGLSVVCVAERPHATDRPR